MASAVNLCLMKRGAAGLSALLIASISCAC